MDREFLKYALDQEHPRINLNGSVLTIDVLELMLEIIKVKGEIQIVNVSDVVNLIEIGMHYATVR